MSSDSGQFPLYEPVFVIWQDAVSIDEWTEPERIGSEPCPYVHSLGFLIEEHEDRIVLALNHDTASGNLSCLIVIPRGMIRAVVSLSAP